MEPRNFVCELDPPPSYSASNAEQLKDLELNNMHNQRSHANVVTGMPEVPPVRDHVIWSMFNTLYLNLFCLGLLALVFSIKSRDRKLLGDRSGALSYGSTARCLNITATALSILSAFITVAIIIFVI